MLTTLLFAMALSDPRATITVQTGRPGVRISPDLYGIFFEEINCGGDGGLYAELVRNRSFEDSPNDPVNWTSGSSGSGALAVLDRDKPLSKENPTSLRLTLQGQGTANVQNHGYWGIPLKQGEQYRLSFYARSDEGGEDVHVSLRDSNNASMADRTIQVGEDWNRYETTLVAKGTDPNGALELMIDKPGHVWLDMVSLFPVNTFKGRRNGLRTDLAEKLADLHPSFMRFPGGCWVEGETIPLAQRWKQTVGDPANRRTQYDLWQYTSTNGLGFHEYLQLCEDIGAAPLFVVNCGMSHKGVVPMDRMDDYVQDAVDAVEYANGPVTSKWGAMRAADGHPEPFNLKYMEIGNEDGGPAYNERFPLIAKAVKARFPDVHLITNVWGGYPKGPYTEIIDEHYYSNPQFFFDNADRYDHYDRKGPQVYVGEYACTEGCGGGNLIAAVSEAAFMTGMERNSDIVRMCSYAPLFANVNHKTWNPDLINFDNHRSLGTPSYYVQEMFSANRGEFVLPTSVDVAGNEKQTFPSGGIGIGTWGTQAEFKDIEIQSGLSKIKIIPTQASVGKGTWKLDGNVWGQTGGDEPTLASFPLNLDHYTLSLKARKTGGREGFLITVGRKDDKNWLWWNVGGWGNSQDAIERCVDGGKSILGQAVSGSVETGRWYDVKIDYSPERIRCYLDGKLIQDIACPSPKPLHVVASRTRNGEIILKVVNSSSTPIATTLNVNGTGTATTLTSASPLDENTLANPKKVFPTTTRFTGPNHTFPAYSVTVIRVGR